MRYSSRNPGPMPHARIAALLAVLLLPIGAAPATAQTGAQVIAAVNAAYAKYKGLKEGANADYIPALAKVDPNLFGIAVVTADGKVYTAGDLKTEVSIQSISKVYTMSLVMTQQRPDAILNGIGADATGMRFNSIVSVEWSYKGLGGSKLENAAEMNPLVNPGAISATSMVPGHDRRGDLGQHFRVLQCRCRPAAHRAARRVRVGGRHQPAEPGHRHADVCLRLHQGEPAPGR